MSQHDFDVANQARSLVLSDINSALSAIRTNSSGTSSPSNPVSFQFWIDTTNNLLKIRNAANNAWVTIGTPSLAGLGLLSASGGEITGVLNQIVGSVGAPGIAWAGDLDSGIYWVSGDTWRFASGGVAYLEVNTTGITFLGTGASTLPNGTTAQRPVSPVNGMIRYSSTLNLVEAYVNGGWKSISSAMTYPIPATDFANALTNAYQSNSDFSGKISPQVRPQFLFTSPSLLTNPVTLPTNLGQSCSWSPNGEYLAIAHITSPNITIYKRTGVELVKLADPATLPGSTATSVSWSSDSQFLSVTEVNSPYINIYQRSGDTFTRLSNPATLPAGQGRACRFSPNGEFLAVAHATTPFMTVYSRSGTTFTKISDPATLPTSTGRSCAWSPDSRFLAIGHDSSPNISIYERTAGTTLTKLADPATLPGSSCYGADFSKGGDFLAFGHTSSPYISIYQRSGTTFTKLSNPATLPANRVWSVNFSRSDKYLVAGVDGAGATLIYEISGTTFTSTGLSVGSTQTNGVEFSPDGQFLAKAIDASPYIVVYQTGSDMGDSSILVAKRKNRSGT